MTAPMLTPLPYLKADTDRHGNIRVYVRVKGRKIRIRERMGSEAFLRAYQEAVDLLTSAETKGTTEGRQAEYGTLRWLAQTYFSSKTFAGLDEKSRRLRRSYLEACIGEPSSPGASTLFGECPLARFGSHHVRILMDRKADEPGSANNRLKYISAMLTYGLRHHPRELKVNVALSVDPFTYESDGFHTWTDEEVALYEARHPIGNKARLAFAILRYTGVRRSDLVILGPQHVSKGWLKFKPKKTAKSSGVEIQIPIMRELRQVLDASSVGNLAFLTTEYGRPFTSKGFGARFKAWCEDAGLPHCSAHGLRKHAATTLAERGASERQLMQWFGWTSPTQASDYVRKARGKVIAEQTAKLFTVDQFENLAGPPENIGLAHRKIAEEKQ